ncbi:MAG: hypothetical protein PHX65_07200 [Sulfurimonas sp.]|nr:hypothetical protein [Sulfurimonas sp.]
MLDKIMTVVSPYKIGIYIGVFFLALAVFAGMKFQINKLEKERDQARTDYAKLVSEYTINAQKYAKDLKEYKSKSKEIETKTVTKIKYIKDFKGDPNASNCENANALINSTIF